MVSLFLIGFCADFTFREHGSHVPPEYIISALQVELVYASHGSYSSVRGFTLRRGEVQQALSWWDTFIPRKYFLDRASA